MDLHFLKLLQKATRLEILGTLLFFVFYQHCPFVFPLLLKYKWHIALCNRGTFILYIDTESLGGEITAQEISSSLREVVNGNQNISFL